MAESTETLTELLEAALCEFEDGIVILDSESRVLFWNPAATLLSGFLGAAMLGRPLPGDFYRHAPERQVPSPAKRQTPNEEPAEIHPERPALVDLRHSQGHSLPVMLRSTPLRNSLGRRFGTLLRFHPVEEIDTLPHGDTSEDGGHEHRIQESQEDMRDRVDEAWREWIADGVPFGVLWIAVDQAGVLRKTHGRDASEAMLAILERTLLHGLRPAEILRLWGTHEFLAVCHERTPELLEAHAQRLCSVARTADFRWWGDRIHLTVSIGAAQADAPDHEPNQAGNLHRLLKRAQKGMQASSLAGGNRATLLQKSGTGGPECSQS